jgi:hypothetical protein
MSINAMERVSENERFVVKNGIKLFGCKQEALYFEILTKYFWGFS